MMFYSACQPEPSFTILEKLTEESGRGNSLFISNNMLHRFSFVLQIETDPYYLQILILLLIQYNIAVMTIFCKTNEIMEHNDDII